MRAIYQLPTSKKKMGQSVGREGVEAEGSREISFIKELGLEKKG